MNNPKTNPISLFFEAFNKNYAAVIAAMLILVTCIMFFTGREIPTFLENLDLMIISYIFGAKAGGK